MSAIGKGDWVECINPHDPLKGGTPYRCAGVVATPGGITTCHGRQDAGILLDGIALPDPACPAWCAGCFRLIYRPKDEFITSLTRDVAICEPVDLTKVWA